MRWLLDRLASWACRKMLDRMFPSVPMIAEHHPWRIAMRDGVKEQPLTFPNRPIMPTKTLVFDDSELCGCGRLRRLGPSVQCSGCELAERKLLTQKEMEDMFHHGQ